VLVGSAGVLVAAAGVLGVAEPEGGALEDGGLAGEVELADAPQPARPQHTATATIRAPKRGRRQLTGIGAHGSEPDRPPGSSMDEQACRWPRVRESLWAKRG
jgi:hypothetical protein